MQAKKMQQGQSGKKTGHVCVDFFTITKNFIAFFVWMLVLSNAAWSQKNNQPVPNKLQMMRENITDGDTLYEGNLPQINIEAKRIFKTEEEAKAYYRLVKNIRRVYPFAILISGKVRECNARLAALPKGQRKAYMKTVEVQMKNEFEKAFRANTVQQAQLLIKLVDRETGKSSYQLIKQFKGGWNAFMWQSLAKLVGTNLKESYDPEGEDQQIERIIKHIEAE